MTSPTQSVFFINSRVPDIEYLVMQLPNGSEWFLINGDSHGLLQIQQALTNRTNLDAIHLITHGSPGSMSLGNGVLNEGNINGFKLQLESIGKSLKSTGDLLIYGCDVGAGLSGQRFIQKVAELTAADVAASNDKTGSNLLGGDWELEAMYGVVKEQPSNFHNYEQLLATEDNTVATNSGTLFNGDDGDNNIQGTLFDDTLKGFAGSDRLDGSYGHDHLDGGSGEDQLEGGAGNDTLMGGTGFDHLNGDLGDDLLYGFSSSSGADDGSGDRLMGHRGNDTLIGGIGHDYLTGNEGTDSLNGGAGNDTIVGGLDGEDASDTDTIQGGSGDDRISIYLGTASGGDGADTIQTWQGVPAITGKAPVLTGGAGSDTYELGAWATRISDNKQTWPWSSLDAPVITDFSSGTNGDKLDVTGFLNYSAANGGYTGGNPFINANGQGYLRITGPEISMDIESNLEWDPDGNTGSQTWVKIARLPNVDSMQLTKDNFPPMMDPSGQSEIGLQLFGTTSNDNLTGNFMNDTLQGNDGNDVLDGKYGADIIQGGRGDDTLIGGVGNDTLSGGSGSNNLRGDLGNDYLYAAEDVLLSNANEIGSSNLFGGDGNDTLIGYLGDDTLNGGTGSDYLSGGDGNDYLVGWVDDFERWSFPEGIDTLNGGNGNDFISVYKGIADGGNGDDKIISWHGSNRVDTQVTLTGGAGEDIFLIDSVAKALEQTNVWESKLAPVITDFETGNKKDKLDISGYIDFSASYGFYQSGNPFGVNNGFFRLLSQGSNTLVQWDRDGVLSGHTFTTIAQLNNVTSDQLGSANFIMDIPPDGTNSAPINYSGTTESDTLTGWFLSDTLRGANGNDILDGSYGHDLIYGDAGNDQLKGGYGNDTIDGGSGQDTLHGDYGDDLLIGSSDSQESLANGKRLLGGSGNDTLYGSQSDDYLDGEFGDDSLLGGAGNDTLNGGGDIAWYPHGTDTLAGGDGDDSLLIWSGQVDGGAGADRFSLWQGIYNYINSMVFKPITVTGGSGADVFALENGEYNTWIADNKAWYSINAPIITDFEVDGLNDKINVNTFLYTSAVDGGYTGGNPFAPSLNYLRLTQDGLNTLLQWDRDGLVNSHDFVNIAVLMNIQSGRIGTRHFEGVNLVGTDGNDLLIGTPFDDTLMGGMGNDTLKGEGGTDDAVYVGQSSDYSIVQIGDYQFTVTDRVAGRDGSDVLYDMEYLKFSDRRVQLPSPNPTTPTITLTAPDLELEPGQSSLVTFTLSEPSLDFTALDVSATGGSISNFSGSGTKYQATFTPNALAKSGAVFVDSEKFRDADGLWNQDGSDLNNVLTYSMHFDKTPPTISLTSSKTILSSGESATITFRLSEPVNDFTLSDMTVKGGTLSNFRGSGTTFYATFTADSASTSAGVYVPSNKFTDLSGNLNKDGFETNNIVTMAIVNVSYSDSVTITEVTDNVGNPNNGIVLLTDGGYSNDRTPTLKGTGTPGKVVTIKDGGSVVGSATVNTDGIWNFTTPQQTNGLHSYTATVTPGGTTAPFNVIVDTASPSIAVTSNKTNLANGETATLTFSLNEASDDFNQGDITVIGGVIGNLQGVPGTSTMYTAIFTPTDGVTTASVRVGSNRFSDGAGNFNQDGAETNNTVTMGVSLRSINLPAPELQLGQLQGRTLHLMHPYVTTTGKVYYVGDLNGNGVIDVQNHGDLGDHASHVWLDNVFNKGADRYDTQPNGAVAGVDDARTLLLNGLTLVNPTTQEIEALRLDFKFNPPDGWDFVDAPLLFNENVATSTLVTPNVHQNIGIETAINYTNLYDGYYNGLFVVQVLGSQTFGETSTVPAENMGNPQTSLDAGMQSPSISLSSSNGTLNSGETAEISFTLSDSSINFKIDDVTVVGGTLSNFRGSGISYTATFTPSADATDSTLYVASDTFSDSSGMMNKDGSDADNTLRLNINNDDYFRLAAPDNYSNSSTSNLLTDPENIFNISLGQVLSSGIITSSGERLLTIDGNENDIVNLSNILDNGENTGRWQSQMTIELNQNSYRFWIHTGNDNAALLIDESIQYINFV